MLKHGLNTLVQAGASLPGSRSRALPLQRQSRIQIVCGKGFGSGSRPKGSSKGKDPREGVQDVLRRPSGVRPVDPEEAARGKVDFVQVKDWGPVNPAPGSSSELGELELADAIPLADPGLGAPLYELLARRLQVLEAQGGLKITDSGTPWPPFHLWTFTLPKYQQYLHDLHAVHWTLEHTLQETLATAELAAGGTTPATAPPAMDGLALQGRASNRRDVGSGSGPVAALSQFGAGLQLQRAAAILQDLQALRQGRTTTTRLEAPPTGEVQETSKLQTREYQGNEASSSSGSNGSKSSRTGDKEMKATPTAVAYAKYIAQIGGEATAAASEGDVSGRDHALLRLVANAYSVHVVHQAFGIRVGASATEKLGLFQKGAVALYKDYPEGVEDAQHRFVFAVDAAGKCLAPHEVELLLQELPKAYTKNALLLGTLAKQ